MIKNERQRGDISGGLWFVAFFVFFSCVSICLFFFYFFLRHLHFRYNIAYCLVAASGERGRLLQYIALLPIYADIVADSREAPRHRKSRLIHD